MSQNWPPQQGNPGPYPQPTPQPTPPYPQGYAPRESFPIQKSNGWAIASLVLGLLGCVPVITSLLATLFGIIGIRVGSRPQTGGKGLAIAGLILGLIGIAGWAIFIGGAVMVYQASAQPRTLARQFVQNLATGDIESAAAQTGGAIPREQLNEISQTLQNAGTLTNLSVSGFDWKSQNGNAQWEIKGTANFANTGTKDFTTIIVWNGTTFTIGKFELK